MHLTEEPREVVIDLVESKVHVFIVIALHKDINWIGKEREGKE